MRSSDKALSLPFRPVATVAAATRASRASCRFLPYRAGGYKLDRANAVRESDGTPLGLDHAQADQRSGCRGAGQVGGEPCLQVLGDRTGRAVLGIPSGADVGIDRFEPLEAARAWLVPWNTTFLFLLSISRNDACTE